MIDLSENLTRHQMIFSQVLGKLISINERSHHKVYLSKSTEDLLSFYLYLHF